MKALNWKTDGMKKKKKKRTACKYSSPGTNEYTSALLRVPFFLQNEKNIHALQMSTSFTGATDRRKGQACCTINMPRTPEQFKSACITGDSDRICHLYVAATGDTSLSAPNHRTTKASTVLVEPLRTQVQ